MSPLFIGGDKVGSVFIGGKAVDSLFYNGDKIYSSIDEFYGTLYHKDPSNPSIIHEDIVYDVADWNKLANVSLKPTDNITFSFGSIVVENIVGFVFNPDSKSSVPASIPANMFRGFTGWSMDLDVPSYVTHIGSSFLGTSNAYKGSGNFEVTLPDYLVSIGVAFLRYRDTFNNNNKQFDLSNTVLTSIGDQLFNNNTSFNQKITLPSTLKTINVLVGSTVFNQSLDLSMCTGGIGKVVYNSDFNSEITLPSSMSSGAVIGALLGGVVVGSFNKSLTLPGAGSYSIGNNFLKLQKSFNKPLTIPSNVTAVGSNFLNCTTIGDFIGPLTINMDVDNWDGGDTGINGPLKGLGTALAPVQLAGTGAADFKAKFPDVTSGSYKRYTEVI